MQNTFRSGISVVSCTNAIIEDCQFLNSGNANQFAGTGVGGTSNSLASNCWIRNCYINNTADYGWAFYDGVTNSGIRDCIVTNSTAGPAIGILTDGGTLPCTNIVIDSNMCSSSSSAGVSVFQSVSVVHTDIVISNNVLFLTPVLELILTLVSAFP